MTKKTHWVLGRGRAASWQFAIFREIMASTFAMIKMFKKIKKEETKTEKTLKSQLMKKFRLSLLGSV